MLNAELESRIRQAVLCWGLGLGGGCGDGSRENDNTSAAAAVLAYEH